jgi:hypothetical protein
MGREKRRYLETERGWGWSGDGGGLGFGVLIRGVFGRRENEGGKIWGKDVLGF